MVCCPKIHDTAVVCGIDVFKHILRLASSLHKKDSIKWTKTSTNFLIRKNVDLIIVLGLIRQILYAMPYY
jgi:hypothetical protein